VIVCKLCECVAIPREVTAQLRYPDNKDHGFQGFIRAQAKAIVD